ncbi:MAG: MBL fold metallo-hydrolase, partial [Chitinophagaceae bacterium]
MIIKQFEDQNLSHYSYAIIDSDKMAVIDPARDPQPYYDFAAENDAAITAVIETHPHADFVSSHLEIHQATGAEIYSSKLLGAKYPQHPFDEGQFFSLGKLKFTAWNTPGHSPDSITVILQNDKGKDIAAFTGDTLFIGDCGRPDLREKAGNIHQNREELASQMFHSLKKFHTLNDEVIVYPAHGSGSLCGKNISSESSNTIGREKEYNWCLQPMEEHEFLKALLDEQPFIPKYFGYNVEQNVKGSLSYFESIAKVNIGGFLKKDHHSLY